MAKLLKFIDAKNRTIWINPSMVAMIEQDGPEKVCVYFGGVDVPSVMLRDDIDNVVKRLTDGSS